MEASFTVPGVPVGKARPRVTLRGGRVWAYTPAKTRVYEEEVRSVARLVFGKPLLGPLGADLTLCFPVPASWSRTKKSLALQGQIRPTGKPDCDNAIKGIFDAMNGVAYKDDSQVVLLTAEKKYAERPCAHVRIWQLE